MGLYDKMISDIKGKLKPGSEDYATAAKLHSDYTTSALSELKAEHEKGKFNMSKTVEKGLEGGKPKTGEECKALLRSAVEAYTKDTLKLSGKRAEQMMNNLVDTFLSRYGYDEMKALWFIQSHDTHTVMDILSQQAHDMYQRMTHAELYAPIKDYMNSNPKKMPAVSDALISQHQLKDPNGKDPMNHAHFIKNHERIVKDSIEERLKPKG